jgi:hypothetical protein
MIAPSESKNEIGQLRRQVASLEQRLTELEKSAAAYGFQLNGVSTAATCDADSRSKGATNVTSDRNLGNANDTGGNRNVNNAKNFNGGDTGDLNNANNLNADDAGNLNVNDTNNLKRRDANNVDDATNFNGDANHASSLTGSDTDVVPMPTSVDEVSRRRRSRNGRPAQGRTDDRSLPRVVCDGNANQEQDSLTTVSSTRELEPGSAGFFGFGGNPDDAAADSNGTSSSPGSLESKIGMY